MRFVAAPARASAAARTGRCIKAAAIGGNDGRNLRVEAILSGNPTPVEPEPDLLRLQAMLRRITDLEAAAAVQWSKIDGLERRASVKVCDVVRERHDQLARPILEKIIEAHDLNI
jgi:hypothetical protein